MMEHGVTDLQTLVGILKAGGEPTRLRLLALLAGGELSVKDMTDILGQSQPRVSRHLKLLADSGLVKRHAEGAWAYYGLASGAPGYDFVHWLIGELDAEEPRLERDCERLTILRDTQSKQAQTYFAQVAESWDRIRNLHVPDSSVEAAILDIAGNEKVELLLDLGTGTGRMLELLAGGYERGIGIDSSREMVAVARSKLANAEIGHAQIRQADIADLDAETGPADLIVLHQVLHYFDDPGLILTHARRALRIGGSILVVDIAPHDLEFLRTEHAHRRLGLSHTQIEAWADGLGLDIAQFRSIPNRDSEEGLTVCLWLLKDRTDGRKA
jgi:ArsR family transcriptional regulator